MDNLKCTFCGSDQFRSGLVKMIFNGIPCTLDPKTGPEYDNVLTDYSLGWDINDYDQVICKYCKKNYTVFHDEEGYFFLEETEKEG